MSYSMGEKNVVIVIGSPGANGNCQTLSQRVAAGVQQAGSDVEIFNLHKLNIKPCTACGECQEDSNKLCTINDDMNILYPKLLKADALVIASPIYQFTFRAYALIGKQEFKHYSL